MTKLVYTLTPGRTGTAWLANLFKANFDCIAVHEYLNFGEIGILSQDIGIMQAFNEWGNKERVQAFWRRKFSLVPKCHMFVETNHALAKCGLIENLNMLPEGSDVTIICIRRDWQKLAMSYINRYDFYNKTVPWQWYLDMEYQNRIVPTEPFQNKGMIGHIVWYIAEVETRQVYYRTLFGDKFRFIDTELEAMTTQAGARSLLSHLGHDGPVHMPDATNANISKTPSIDPGQVKQFLDRVKFDPDVLAKAYIKAGRRLDVRSAAPVAKIPA